MTRAIVVLGLALAAGACAPPVAERVPMETCIEAESDDPIDVVSINAGEPVHFAGPVVDGFNASANRTCATPQANSFTIATDDDVRIRLSWGHATVPLAVDVSGIVDVTIEESWPETHSFAIVDADGLLAAFNPLSEFTSPELDDVTVTRGDSLGTYLGDCGVISESNIAVTSGGVRTVVAPEHSASVDVDGVAFTFHAFGASTTDAPRCTDNLDLFSWALVRDPR